MIYVVSAAERAYIEGNLHSYSLSSTSLACNPIRHGYRDVTDPPPPGSPSFGGALPFPHPTGVGERLYLTNRSFPPYSRVFLGKSGVWLIKLLTGLSV